MLSKIIFVQNWQKLNEQFVNNYMFSKIKQKNSLIKEMGKILNITCAGRFSARVFCDHDLR